MKQRASEILARVRDHLAVELRCVIFMGYGEKLVWRCPDSGWCGNAGGSGGRGLGVWLFDFRFHAKKVMWIASIGGYGLVRATSSSYSNVLCWLLPEFRCAWQR
jgi:hypothetical protein